MMKPLQLYIHIPFCVRKCKYCDFLSAPATPAERGGYVESLCRKIRAFADMAKAYRVTSIFVGGGTPSILDAGQMEDIFTAVRETFFIEEDAELTLEMNPGTVTGEKLAVYRSLGINRLSIGLQSADDGALRALGRIHVFRDFLETYEMARRAGFGNINVDLMSAIPFQTVESWSDTLETTAKLKPEHISAYSLMIEEGTPFYERYGRGEHAEELPDEDVERRMYWHTRELLEKYGYHHYEISNYAKKGYECRHNLGYWDRAEYLGIGTGAASLMDNRRWIEGEEPEVLSLEDQMAEYMFLGLRKMEGVSAGKFKETFQRDIWTQYGVVIGRMEEKGLLEEKSGKKDIFLRLTERGIDVSNYVMSEFLP